MKPETSLYFATICTKGDRQVYLGGHLLVEGSEPTGTSLLSLSSEGKWAFVSTVPSVVIGLSHKTGSEELLVVGREGDTYLSEGDGPLEAAEPVPMRGPTYLSNVIQHRSQFLLFGGSNQVFLGDGTTWSQIDDGIFREFQLGRLDMIYAACDRPGDLLDVAGRSGFCATRSGSSWRVHSPPTNLSMQCIEALSPTTTVFAGVGGHLIIREGDDVWYDLTEDIDVNQTIWDLKRYGGKLFLALGSEVMVLKETAQREFEIVERRAMDVNRFCVNDFLWCIGGETVTIFDGATWEEFVCPANT